MSNSIGPIKQLKARQMTVKTSLAEFDRLPRDQKEVLWDAFDGRLYACGFSSAERLRTKIEELQRKSTREVYGPDHPQAERSKGEDLLADLNLL